MADFTGEVIAKVGGQEYRLALGLRGIARLQEEYGANLDPIQGMGQAEGDLPDFSVLLRIVDVALERHHPEVAGDVAEQLLAADMSLPGKLLTAAFPDQKSEGRPGKSKARR
ncbi:hypothetical protein pben1_p45 [Paracoccus phage vB_PbeS_Pben1]|uniref:Uncharacterized protein n=1 Tax=Paracoccus versutus TaxID=34007 RepID=A0A3D9XPF4_PARVE|nr:hypothetical protein [Paracoccus versutus]AZV00202.1 hypothetical protein pben1_p45 [Paracoccus phage vB_PbeS_Pben1]REF72314.1 hypothetical protein BDD41_0783 [Paracoccus versutus]WGR55705.1 hypothetical protein E3U25_06935 [Paracoccus versutus]